MGNGARSPSGVALFYDYYYYAAILNMDMPNNDIH
jgi:hypothetical protein